MFRHAHWMLISSCFISIVCEASPSGADPRTTPAAGPAQYGYVFQDDPLDAGGFGPHDAHLRVRGRAWRTTLIRCRTDFVPELLKSVEGL